MFDCIGSLVGKSLVIAEDGNAGEPRFRLLETIREYALDELQANGEEAAARDAHAQYTCSASWSGSLLEYGGIIGTECSPKSTMSARP